MLYNIRRSNLVSSGPSSHHDSLIQILSSLLLAVQSLHGASADCEQVVALLIRHPFLPGTSSRRRLPLVRKSHSISRNLRRFSSVMKTIWLADARDETKSAEKLAGLSIHRPRT